MWQVRGMDRYFWFCYQTEKQPPRNVELFCCFSHNCTLKTMEVSLKTNLVTWNSKIDLALLFCKNSLRLGVEFKTKEVSLKTTLVTWDDFLFPPFLFSSHTNCHSTWHLFAKTRGKRELKYRGVTICKTSKTEVLPKFGSYIRKTFSFKTFSITLGLVWGNFRWRPCSIYSLDRVIHERDIYKLRMTFGPKSEKRAVGKIHSSAKMN